MRSRTTENTGGAGLPVAARTLIHPRTAEGALVTRCTDQEELVGQVDREAEAGAIEAGAGGGLAAGADDRRVALVDDRGLLPRLEWAGRFEHIHRAGVRAVRVVARRADHDDVAAHVDVPTELPVARCRREELRRLYPEPKSFVAKDVRGSLLAISTHRADHDRHVARDTIDGNTLAEPIPRRVGIREQLLQLRDRRVDRDRVLGAGGVDTQFDVAVDHGHLCREVGPVRVEREHAPVPDDAAFGALDRHGLAVDEDRLAVDDVDGHGEFVTGRHRLVDGVAVLDAVAGRAVPLGDVAPIGGDLAVALGDHRLDAGQVDVADRSGAEFEDRVVRAGGDRRGPVGEREHHLAGGERGGGRRSPAGG